MSIPVPLEGFGGGGGTSLNFDVKGYATEELLLAATPSKYTIGIITDVEIFGYAFDAAEPTEPAEGMVWITVGTSSTVEFNALKKNAIQVYPLSAKQYVDGAWVDVTAYSYQDGGWHSWWDGTLYDTGNEYEEFTGGWSGIGLTKGEEELVIAPTSSNRGTAWTNDPVNLSGYKTVKAIVSTTITQYSACAILISTDQTANDSETGLIAKSVMNTVGTHEGAVLTLDISSGLPDGTYYIKMFQYDGNGTKTLRVSKIWAEK